MPYIKEERREPVEIFGPSTPGELNYALTKVIELYRFRAGEGYKTFNDILGALEAAKLEFYRRVVVPYEDFKNVMNGDVYASPPSK